MASFVATLVAKPGSGMLSPAAAAKAAALLPDARVGDWLAEGEAVVRDEVLVVAVARGDAGTGHDRCRCGQPQCAWAGNHQHCDGIDDRGFQWRPV